MNDLGLVAGAFPCPIDWRGDESKFRADLEMLPPILGAAATLGLKRTGTWVLPETPTKGADRARVAAFHFERIGELARLLDRYQIRLGLEVIGVESFRTGRGDRFVASLADLDRELKPIWDEAPNLGLLLDAFHLYAADEPIEAGLAGASTGSSGSTSPTCPTRRRRIGRGSLTPSADCRATLGRLTSEDFWRGWTRRGTTARSRPSR